VTNVSRIFPLLIAIFIQWTLFSQEVELVVQTGHAGVASIIEFSENGKLMATGGSDNNIILWEVRSGRQIKVFRGHTDIISDLAFVAEDQIIVSASKDKTIKLWNLQEDSAFKEFNLNFNPTSLTYSKPGNDIYFTAKSLRNFDLDTLRLNTFKSPKRKDYTTVSVLNDGSLIYGGNRNRFYHYTSQGTKKIAGSVKNCQATPDGKSLIVTSKKGDIVQYKYINGKFRFRRTFLAAHKKHNSAKTIAINDTRAVAFSADNVLTVYDLKTGRQIKHLKGHTLLGKDMKMTPDGKSVVSSAGDGTIYMWDVATGNLIREFKSTASSINFAKFTEDQSSIVIGYNDGVIRHWDLKHSGGVITHRFSLPRYKAKQGWTYSALHFSGVENGYHKFRIAHAKRFSESEYLEQVIYSDFYWNVNTGDKYSVQLNIEDHDDGQLKPESILTKQNASVTVGKRFLVANKNEIELIIDQNTYKKNIITSHTSNILSVDYSPKKKIYLSAGWDGRVIMYNYKLEEIATLVSVNNNDFVIMVEGNYYYSTKGALQYIGFRDGLKIQSFQQFDLFYNRPDLVYKEIPYATNEEISNFKKLYVKRIRRAGAEGKNALSSESTTELNLLNLTGNITKENKAKLRIVAKDSKGIESIHVKVDGVPLYGLQGKKIGANNFNEDINIELNQGINKIEVWATNSEKVKSMTQQVVVNSLQKKAKSNLYFVGMGVSDYVDSERNLKYAVKDVLDVEKAIKKNKICNQTFTQTFLNTDVKKETISEIGSFLNNANVNDIVIIYYAGHGLLDNDLNYYLAAHDNDFSNPASKSIPYEAIEEIMINLPSRKKVILLDACHSGEIDTENVSIKDQDVIIGEDIKFRGYTALENLDEGNTLDAVKTLFADIQESNGVTVISSAGGAEYALESEEWENGAFTHSLLKGLKNGTPDKDENSIITIFELLDYLRKDVSTLTNGIQVPTYRSENIDSDFIIWKK